MGLFFVAKKIIDKGKSIQENRDAQITNILSHIDAPYFIIDESYFVESALNTTLSNDKVVENTTEGEVVDVSLEVIKDVKLRAIYASPNPNGPWVHTGNEEWMTMKDATNILSLIMSNDMYHTRGVPFMYFYKIGTFE